MFDPFKKRVSRDIRNRLAERFLHTLTKGDWPVFEAYAATMRRKAPDRDHSAFIDGRMGIYQKVYQARTGKNPMELARLLWKNGLYFECHEWVEPLWQAATGAEKKALQGIIRAAGALVLYQADRSDPAASSARKALEIIRAHERDIPLPFTGKELVNALEGILAQ